MNELTVLAYPWPFGHEFVGRSYVIVVGVAQDGRIAWVRSSEPGRSWELPGGAIEDGETAGQAAIREFREETGAQLEGAVIAARIDNVIAQGRKPQSHAFLVAGSFESSEILMSTNSEVTECAVMTSSPQDSTFGQDWNDQLIKIGRNRLTSTINQQMWSRAACSYNDHVEISNRDVHYGPLIAGESALRLLPSIRNSRVLDLGCGAGHNLAALSHAGASSGLGIDFSGDQAKQARARLPGTFQVVEADITVYDFAAAGPFDLALSVFSVPFVPDLTALLGAAARSLRRGGTLLLSTNHPCRSIEPPTDRAAEPRCRSGVRRLWSFPGLPLLPFFHYLHDLPTIISALANAGLVVEAIVEPRALPMAQLAAAPYQSAYYVSRHEELSRAPYTLILKARKL